MTADTSRIQPVVLAGGRSTRFGSDKLRARLGTPGGREVWLIDRPVAALRAVFGPRVALVGDCAEAVAARADHAWPDALPGTGPAGGVLTALERSGTDVFTLAGDLPAITPEIIARILDAAAAAPDAWAILARSTDIEPCIGLYRTPMRDVLHARLRPRGGGHVRASLHDAAPPGRLALIDIPPAVAANVNHPSDL